MAESPITDLGRPGGPTARVGDTFSSAAQSWAFPAGKTEPPASSTPCNNPLPPPWAVLCKSFVLTCPAPRSVALLSSFALCVPRHSQLSTDSRHSSSGSGHLLLAPFVCSPHDTKLQAIPISLANTRPKQTRPRGLLPRTPARSPLSECSESPWHGHHGLRGT